MSAVVEKPRANAAVPAAGPRSEPAELRHALLAVSELLGLTTAEGEVAEHLHQIAERVAQTLAIKRCAIYTRSDARADAYVGSAAWPGSELEAEVRRLVLGGPTDRITEEIAKTRQPLLIRDTRSDPRALTGAARRYKLRSLLAVPILSGQKMIGVMMLDNGEELHRYAPVDIEIAQAFARLIAVVMTAGQAGAEMRLALDTANRQNRLLRRTAMAEHRLSEVILAGGGLSAIVDLVTKLTGKPTTLYDVHGQVVSAASAPDSDCIVTLMEDMHDDGSVRAALERVLPGASTTIEPQLGADIRRRHLAAPLDIRGERWGWIVMMEHPTRLGAFDDFLLRRAATHVALELAGRQQIISSSADARAQLARHLVRGTTVEEDLRRNAEFLGVALDVPRVIAYFSAEPGAVEVAEIVEALQRRTGSGVLCTQGPEGVALLIELPHAEPAATTIRRVTRDIREALGETCEARVLVGASAICRGPGDIPGGYRVARQVTRCIENFPHGDSHRVLAADDLGPGRLFVANGHPEEIERFVEDVLGHLLDDDESSVELIRTLEAVFDNGRSVRLASEKLGVHENTVRYRLARVHAITGLDVAADADDQLSVQVALLVLRLQGHRVLRPFDSAVESETCADCADGDMDESGESLHAPLAAAPAVAA